MKKARTKLTPEQAVEFLESFRKLKSGQDEPTQLISLRVPKNILTTYKRLALVDGKKYQSMMIQALREYVASTRQKKD